MKKSYDLWITNLITNEIVPVHDFDLYYRDNDDLLTSCFLFVYLKPFLDKEIPFKLEFVYKDN